ncbi:MAG: mce4A [Nocardia sp.]|uniref:MCE family protein n=1 Tax=Nocardia sp. TaxID=1821 RepID=UPI00262BDAA3|nr:MCE family protein [Nocardia sp.]MCU1643024.1 mce4A [Nocardia sp.]
MGHLREFGRNAYILMGVGLIVIMMAVTAVSIGFYRGSFLGVAGVTLYADRSGLMLEKGSDVKVRGVVVGHVSGVELVDGKARIAMNISTDYTRAIPANVRATIDPTTLFGRKFVTLSLPERPSATTITTGSVIENGAAATEVNDLLESLVTVLRTVEPQRVSATLTALSVALHGRGPAIGQLVSDLDSYLTAFNPQLDTLRRDMHGTADTADVLAAAAPDLLTTVDRLSTTGDTITAQQKQLSAFLLSFTSFGNRGGDLFQAAGAPLQASMAALVAPTGVLAEFAPIYPCFLSNLHKTNTLLENTVGGSDRPGLNILGTLLMGDPPYRVSQDLPKTGLDNAPSCYATGDQKPGHVPFDDGSHAYRTAQGPEDLIGNPLAELLFGGWR